MHDEAAMTTSSTQVQGKTLSDISWVSVSRWFSEALYVVRGVVLARLLGPESFGVWSSMSLVRRFVRYSPLGSIHGMVQLAPRADGHGDRVRATRYRETAVGFGLGAALLSAVLIMVIAYGGAGPSDPTRRHLWLGFAVVLIGSQLYEIRLAVLRSQQEFITASMIRIGVAVSSTVLGAVAAWRFGLPGFLVALGTSYAMVLMFKARSLQRPKVDLPTARELIGTGFTIVGAQLLQALMRNVDKILVWAVLGSRALGIYAVPFYLVSLTLLLPTGVTTVAYPRILEQTARKASYTPAWPYLERAMVLIGQLVCPVLALLFLTLHLPITWWLPDYASAIAPGRVLLLVGFFPIIAALPATVLLSLQEQRKLIVLRGAAVIVSTIVVTATLASGGDLVGVALATAPGFALLSVATMVVALRQAQLPTRRRVRAVLWTLFPYALLLALLAATAGPVTPVSNSWSGGVREVLPRMALVCGVLLVWGAWSTHRLGIFSGERTE